MIQAPHCVHIATCMENSGNARDSSRRGVRVWLSNFNAPRARRGFQQRRLPDVGLGQESRFYQRRYGPVLDAIASISVWDFDAITANHALIMSRFW
jgi:hypothetical protein